MPSFASDSEAALKNYWELGYHIETGIWEEEQLDEIIQAAQNFPSFKDGTYAPLMQPHRSDSVFLAALRNPNIVKIMEQLCSGQVSGLQSEFFYGKPGTPGFTKHQDNSFLEAKPDSFASAWTAMQDVTADMGALVGYLGSHREPVLPIVKVESHDQSLSQDPNANHEEVVLPSDYESLPLTMPRGSVLFIHSHFVHSSGGNTSDRFRSALLLTYIRSGEPFRPGNTAKRSEVELYG
jgi:phytanoyl-CoA hydroxylase